MSNIGSTALQTKSKTSANVPPMGPAQTAFNAGTRNMLDDARQIIENAVGQGQQLNPLIYEMLGLQPQYEDHSADLAAAQKEYDASQSQFNNAQQTIAQIESIPKKSQTPAQRQQLRQLQAQLPKLESALGKTKAAFNQLQTMPKTITGFTKMDPSQIPADSPFSSQNPLNQAQATEAQRLNEYLKGGAVDPTLSRQYDQAEQNLRAKLAQRFGPDYESTSVGQMALQNFARQKNEAFATWNQQQVQNYNAMAFGGAGALQQLLGGQIGLMREPESTAIAGGNALSNLGGQRLAQQQTAQQWLLGQRGITTQANIAGNILGGLGSLATTPYNQHGDTLASTAASAAKTGVSDVASGIGSAASGIYNWATGGNSAAAASAADAAAGGGGAGDLIAF